MNAKKKPQSLGLIILLEKNGVLCKDCGSVLLDQKTSKRKYCTDCHEDRKKAADERRLAKQLAEYPISPLRKLEKRYYKKQTQGSDTVEHILLIMSWSSGNEEEDITLQREWTKQKNWKFHYDANDGRNFSC